MNLQDFINKYQNKSWDWDGYYGPQCVDLIQFYANALGLPRFSGNAKDIINQASDSWQRVDDPKPGDVFVTAPSAENGYAGHTGIIVPGGVLEQNYGDSKSVVHNRKLTNVLGYLRPKTLKQESDMAYSEDQYKDISTANHNNKVLAIQGFIQNITGNYHTDKDVVKYHLGSEAEFNEKERNKLADEMFASDEYKDAVNSSYKDAYGRDATPGEKKEKREARIPIPQLRVELMRNK